MESYKFGTMLLSFIHIPFSPSNMEEVQFAPPPPSLPSPPPPPPPEAAEPAPEKEARRLKSLAEEKLQASSLKSALKYARRARSLSPDLDGISVMITALKILRAAASDHYKTLRIEPFSPIGVIKKQYKSLALALHPDKAVSPVPGAEDAFKRVTDSFRFLSDRRLKKEFDLRLRVELAAAAAGGGTEKAAAIETFWTACTTCRLLHEFDRRYVGYRLMCPTCRKSFLAVEVNIPSESKTVRPDGDEARVRVTAARSRTNARPRVPTGWTAFDRKRKIGVSGSPESKKSKQRREKTLAELQMEITNARKKDKNKDREKEKGKEKEKATVTVKEKNNNLSLMAVEDSDFYDFDKDRSEKCFVKGQVWAIYDDDDGMPRHYGLIDEVLSSNPFRVKMSWLDIQNNGDEALMLWENSGYHISCGRFKVGRKVDIHSVNFFSHLVECERAAREVYRIYPKKGSVWALYGERNSGGEEARCYDIVIFLTSYSEMYGLSMAHLEKVEGYKTIFRRREIGVHAVRWFEKDEVRLFSHQIPSRKLVNMEGVDLPKECWELDPASLPPDLLRICWVVDDACLSSLFASQLISKSKKKKID